MQHLLPSASAVTVTHLKIDLLLVFVKAARQVLLVQILLLQSFTSAVLLSKYWSCAFFCKIDIHCIEQLTANNNDNGTLVNMVSGYCECYA